MTQLLKKAFDEVSKLPEQEQNDFAAWLLEELASEQRWADLFAKSENKLSQLAAEALAEHRKGKTRVLDAENL